MTKLSSTGTRAVLLVALLWGAAPGARILAALDREAYGKTLAEWLTLYWRWNMAGSDPATGGVGNVKFLPIP